MRLTATDKAIGELNMHRAGLDVAKALVLKYGAENAIVGIEGEIDDANRCIALLSSVGSKSAKPVKAEKPKAAKKNKRALPVYEEVEA